MTVNNQTKLPEVSIPEKDALYLKEVIQPFMRDIASKVDKLIEKISEDELKRMKEIFKNGFEISLDTNSGKRLTFNESLVWLLEREYHIFHWTPQQKNNEV